MFTIILAAGRASRFKAAGIDTPKQMLLYGEKPVIHHILENVENSNCVLLAGAELSDSILYLPKTKRLTTIRVSDIQNGPACTAILAGAEVDNTAPVLILDSDVVISKEKLAEFAELCLSTGTDAAVMTTSIEEPSNKYCSVYTIEPSSRERWSIVKNIGEKDCGSTEIVIGAYYFKNWTMFVKNVCKCVATEEGEIFMSSVISMYIKSKLRVIALWVSRANWTPLGTPEELDRANNILRNLK